MFTKEEYYEEIKKVRELLKNPENLKCTCPKKKCEWHGNCVKCVAQHRVRGGHIPTCLQKAFEERLRAMAAIFEFDIREKDRNPEEYWDYVREMDERQNNK